MTPRPKLSIVTPSLNQGPFIERTIRSVLDQGYENLEYLVVDGGSEDGTVETIRSFEDRISWWVSEPDGGQTDALNKGFARATGEVVAWINSDDHYLPGAFDRAIDALERTGSLWASGAARFTDGDDRTTHVWRPELPPMGPRPVSGRHWWALYPWSVPQPSTFWRREAFDEVGPLREDLHYAFDTEFFLRLAYAGHMPALIDAELSVRVVHPDAKSVDREPFDREIAMLPDCERPYMTASERRKLSLTRALVRTRVLGAAAKLRRGLEPVLGPSGDGGRG
jgi:glycosyltransferase involved in cell wall biosynthesis